MLLVNSHKLKMAAASTPGREYNRRAAIIEGLRAERSPTDYYGCQAEEWSLACPLPRGCPHYCQNKMSGQCSCRVLCPVRVISCHRISLKIKKRSLKKCTLWRVPSEF